MRALTAQPQRLRLAASASSSALSFLKTASIASGLRLASSSSPASTSSCLAFLIGIALLLAELDHQSHVFDFEQSLLLVIDELCLPSFLALDIGHLGHGFVQADLQCRPRTSDFGVCWGSVLPMDGKWRHLPGEHRLAHLALPFHLEQERLFHQLPQCLFREARLIITRDSIPQIAHGNGRRVHIPLPF